MNAQQEQPKKRRFGPRERPGGPFRQGGVNLSEAAWAKLEAMRRQAGERSMSAMIERILQKCLSDADLTAKLLNQ